MAYAKIDRRIWNDAKFRKLSDKAKLVFFFLLTHPNLTSLGAMRASVPGLAAELGWSSLDLALGLTEGQTQGMIKVDEEACFIWLPRYMKYNRPESKNVVMSWEKSYELLPECELKDELVQQVRDLTEDLPETFRKVLPKVFVRPSVRPSVRSPASASVSASVNNKKEKRTDTEAMAAIRSGSDLDTPEIRQAWSRFVEHVRNASGRTLGGPQAEATVMELGRRGPAKALRDLEFSVRVGAKTLRDSDHDFEKPPDPEAEKEARRRRLKEKLS